MSPQNILNSISKKSIFRFEGSQIMEPLRGYKSIIDQMLSAHKDELFSRLKLSHTLEKIFICTKLDLDKNNNVECKHCKYSSDPQQIVLAVRDEQRNEIKIVCERVICTMSLGVLKHSLSDLIEPTTFVPATKLESVARLGFDAINKIFLVFDKPVWNDKFKNANGFYMVWLPGDDQKPLVADLNHHSSVKTWYENISGFEVAEGNENVLIGWISGKEEYEHLDDQTVLKECISLLRTFTNDPTFPEPKSVLRQVI